ncbi:hypothetical protein ACTFIW_005793 [Dictyostelium discoideum]
MMKIKSLIILVIVVCLSVFTYAGRDFYDILGITRDSSPADIKRSYRKLSVKYHPDKNPDKKDMYIEINSAYETLSDPEKRRIYDQYGEEGLKQNHGGGGFDPFDIFSVFGGGGRHQQQAQQQQRGADIELELEVTLKDLYVGKTTRVTHKKQVLCTKCRGSGAKKASDVTTCGGCKGSGIKLKVQQLGPGFVQQIQSTCDECGGKGKKVTSKCPHCHGKKVEIGEETYTIEIERGMNDQSIIKLEQLGEESPDVTPGDIIFKIVTSPDSKFRRSGDNLYYDMSITLLEALVGFKKEIDHLDGHKVEINRVDVTSPGLTIKVDGEGMPHHSFPSQTGDLYVIFNIIFPQKVSAEDKLSFEKLLK